MFKGKKILLIQSHSDDILFSASKFLFNKEDYSDIVILTVENDEVRNLEDKALSDLFGVKNVHLKELKNDLSYYNYYKDNKKRTFNFPDSLTSLEEHLGKKQMNKISKELNKSVDKYISKGYKIICNLGVGHPLHYFVRKCIESKVDLFYRDFPHSYKRKTKDCMENELLDFKLKETYEQEVVEHSDKWEVAYQIYKTQRSLLFFEKGYIDKRLPEEYYVKED